jgi:large subunit ribosomal protein L25
VIDVVSSIDDAVSRPSAVVRRPSQTESTYRTHVGAFRRARTRRPHVSEVKLTAQPRTEFGKGAARRLRRADMVPAVLYGHGTDPVHVALPGHATMMALKQSNALLNLDVNGKSTLALPKDVQRDPLKGFIEHVDLLIVRRGEKVTVDVPLHITGEPVSGALVTTEATTLSLEVEATHIPQSVEHDITDAEIGTQVLAGDVKLPSGATLVTDAESLVVNIVDAERAGAAAAGDEAEGEAAEGAEGEAAEAAAEEQPAEA